jgi:hypothetical protein
MSHSAHEAKRSCTALTNLEFRATGDVTVCTGALPIGNIKETPIRRLWENRPRLWEQGCCLARRCTQAELHTITPSASLTAAGEWKE